MSFLAANFEFLVDTDIYKQKLLFFKILRFTVFAVSVSVMGKNSSKIDQETAKTVKRKILKNNSFCEIS